MPKHSCHILLAVFLLAGKVTEGLLPQGGLLLPMALTHGNHLPVLLVLHVVMHDLLEPGARNRAHLMACPTKIPRIFLSPEGPPNSQLPLLIEVKDPILEVMHLA